MLPRRGSLVSMELPRAVAGAAVAVNAADGVLGVGAAADDVVDELAVAAHAIVLQDLAVLRLDADRLFEDELRARRVRARRLEGEARRVVIPVHRLGDVLLREARRHVAVVA